MFDVDRLLQLGLFNQLIPIWQVFFYIASMLPFLLLDRLKICLFLTYLFTFYLGFIVQWGDYLAASGVLLPFLLYTISGIVIPVAFVILLFREEGIHTSFTRRKSAETLKQFDPEQRI